MAQVRQALFLIQFPTSAPFCQVEDWPRTVSRSCAGALHVRPGGTKKVTRTELDHLKTKKPWGAQIRVIKKVVPPPPSSASEQKQAKAEEQAAAAEKVPKSGGGQRPKRVGGGTSPSAGGSEGSGSGSSG
jgi:hypothetical protein